MPFDYSYQTLVYMEIVFLVTSTKMYLNFKVIILSERRQTTTKKRVTMASFHLYTILENGNYSERKQVWGCLWTTKEAWIAKGHQETFQLWWWFNKTWLKAQLSKTKIMASGLITSWQIDGETMETVIDFIFLGSKITVDGDCSHEIKRHLLLGGLPLWLSW